MESAVDPTLDPRGKTEYLRVDRVLEASSVRVEAPHPSRLRCQFDERVDRANPVTEGQEHSLIFRMLSERSIGLDGVLPQVVGEAARDAKDAVARTEATVAYFGVQPSTQRVS
jgi:hypothetical protein